jgi:hypothetical protein
MNTHIEIDDMIELFNDLKQAITNLYSSNSYLEMHDVLDKMALMEFYIAGDLYNTWLLQRRIYQREKMCLDRLRGDATPSVSSQVEELPSPIEHENAPTYFS